MKGWDVRNSARTEWSCWVEPIGIAVERSETGKATLHPPGNAHLAGRSSIVW